MTTKQRGHGAAAAVTAFSTRLAVVPKRLFLWVAEAEFHRRRRGTNERNLPFAQLTMAVIVGVVIQGTATSMTRGPLLANYRAVLLITSLLLFVEMYVVLLRYHERLGLPYVNLYMFTDLVIAILFVYWVTLVTDSWNEPAQLDRALVVLGALFLVLLLRQLVAYADLILQSGDLEAVLRAPTTDARLRTTTSALIFGNADIRARLAAAQLIPWILLVPMLADLVGLAFAVGARWVFDITWFAWVGLVGFLVYELVMFGLVLGATAPARKTAEATPADPVALAGDGPPRA